MAIFFVPIHDPFGNIVALLDTSGEIVESYRYTAFGEMETFSTPTTVDNPWRFSSKRFDSETGFIYFGMRYYAPDVGRWITPDPAGFADGPNLYTYVHNHPLSQIDPDGQFAFALLAPFVISLAAEYCLPTVAAYLGQYAGGAATAAFLTGMLQGYNGSCLEPSSFAGADLTTYL
nr:RHS repeat-associated core domain-containing protein [Parachlamydiaceae bacterium]